MGAIYDFENEKLIVGVIYHDAEVLNIAMERLIAAFGEVEDVSEEFSFSLSAYFARSSHAVRKMRQLCNE